MKAAEVKMQGHAPGVVIEGPNIKKMIGNPERFKYEAAWKHDDYRKYSPGEQIFPLFMDTCKPPRNAKLVDWGSGTGRAGYMAWQNGLDVTFVDFIEHSLDETVRNELCDTLKFVKHDIVEPIDMRCDYAYCCDVLEHIPEKDINTVLTNILTNCREAFFQIATVEDHFGEVLDHGPLHLTVHEYNWWLKKFSEMNVIVLHSNEFDGHVAFHVSAHRDFFFTRGGVNTSQEQIHDNIRTNKKWDVKQLSYYEPQDMEVVFLAGGPSLNDFTDEIIEHHRAGKKIITVNGAYQWAQDHGINNVTQFMIDAREFNNRFVDPVRDDCKYIIASQCDPSVFEKLPEKNTYMWQVSLEDEDIEVVDETYGEIYKDWWPIPGGCSVTLRALCALNMMGYRQVHVYGFDSCVMEDNTDEHHAYEQEENDGIQIIDVRVGKGTKNEREFKCQDWMAVQAKEFCKLTSIYLKDMKLIVYGDGLIAHIVKSGASL